MTIIAGGEAIARMLRAHGVGPMFGMAGFQLLPLYEGIRTHGLEHHLVNDERTGAFAADAYARVTGRPGVCDATLGPGATNLVTALVESLNAGVPIVAIVGNSHREHAWKNMTQEARQADILRPACKELIRVEHPARVPELVRRAFAVATSGRPGPVVLDVPEDVAHAELEYEDAAFQVDPGTTSIPARRTRPAADDVARAAELLIGAERPLILAGGGVHLSHAYDALARIVDEQGIPVAHTLSGKGAVACSHPLSAGLFGRYDRFANALIGSADCLLVVGCKLGEIATKRYTLPPSAVPLVHVDINAEELGRWARTDVALWSDAATALADLADALASLDGARIDRAAYAAEIAQRRAEWLQTARPRLQSSERPVNMGRLIAELNELVPSDGILVADGGFASHWAGLLYDTKQAGRGFIADRGFASIGYGLPGAMGARLARSSGPIVGITGDGGLNMTIGDLETARRARAGFTLLVVNNAASGYVKALQHAVYGADRYQSSDLLETDYATLARGYGCHGIRVEDPGDLREAIAAGLSERDVPTIVDVVVTRDPRGMLPAADSRTLEVKAGDRPI
jgi:acetolactate synthase-1/2/3 large subunit